MASARRTLAVTSLGTLVVLVAYTAPLVTINQVAAGLSAGTSGRTWVLSSMSIGLGALVLTSGRLADDYGRRRVFVAGSLLLAVGSLASLVAGDPTTFVLTRIVQGAGGAAVLAASLGILGHVFPAGPERARATGLWGASVGAGIAIGPVLTAWLTRVDSWRDVYAVLAAAGVGLAVAGRGLAECRGSQESRLDLPGVLLLVIGITALLAGLTEGRQGWGRAPVVVLLAAAALLLTAYVVVEHRSSHPMLDLGLFLRPPFVAATVAALANGAGVIALLSTLAGFVGRAFGWSALTASLLMLAWSATSVVTALLARRLPETWSGRSRLAGSLLVVAAGQLLLAGLDTGSGTVRLLPGLLVAGAGSGVLNAALGRESVASVPPQQAGLGSGANNTARYLGAALGITVVAVVATPSGVPTPAALVSGWDHAVLVTAAVSVAGAAAVLLTGVRRPHGSEAAENRSPVHHRAS